MTAQPDGQLNIDPVTKQAIAAPTIGPSAPISPAPKFFKPGLNDIGFNASQPDLVFNAKK